ncbi:probable LRR receptor-like serine/threonine-protein kinase At1g67720 [Dioscorea cayenensis subsp. rotundata]|uniref:Probable LRR receptor-like serine/threonine-protein kinase At1g67720 n=1 Tax=Dioscorea cayennensis subsp. rotundata TaxID=55577 RepID=A0AB40CY76_DIOCR|nr:probable LRR receptor-like serine/threonine-protein kinase At1g67720 [Dioscorea cayenensis subsp. rotundata]
MRLSIFLLLLLCIAFPLHVTSHSNEGHHINCGSQKETTIEGIKWITEHGLTKLGKTHNLDTLGILPTLSSLRYFPEKSVRKYCYTIPVIKGGKYLIRTSYYYGGFDAGNEPPVFDQIVGETKWSVVNTSENYAKGLSTYYEIITVALRKKMCVCLARNEFTVGNPFISTLEFEYLNESMYNETDFKNYALATTSRHRFGLSDGAILRHPDDPFNRYWQSFADENPVVESHTHVSSSDFWNNPPETVFRRGLTTSRGKKLILKWPPANLQNGNYYITLYFQDNRTPSPFSWRIFDIKINGENLYTKLNVSTAGIMVYSAHQPLSGQVTITLIPDENSPVGPVINAAEILQIVPLGRRTHTRDVNVMEDLARRLKNVPIDWSGDPCMPKESSWTGVSCSEGKFARVVSINLTNFGLVGTLPQSIGKLTAVKRIWLGGNKLHGNIPDMSYLKHLVSLHLENNQFNGSIPTSLEKLEKLQELYLQNNNLRGELPSNLRNRGRIKIQYNE